MAFAVILAICGLFGAAMGWLIHRVEIPAFIVTLAGLFLARGGAFLVSTQSVPIEATFYADLPAYVLVLPGGRRLSVSAMIMIAVRSEVRRVGKVCVSPWRFRLLPDNKKKNMKPKLYTINITQ